MAYAGYHHSQADAALATKSTAFLDQDDSAVLDPSLLESDMMHSPSDHPFRKDSFAISNGVLSPAESHGWEPQFAGALSVDAASVGVSNAYHDDASLYPPPNTSRPPTFSQNPSSWAFDHGSGHATPTTGVKYAPPPPPPQFDGSRYIIQRPGNGHANFAQPAPHPTQHFQGPPPEAGFIPAPQVQTPMSPHSHQDWMGMAQQEMESRPPTKRVKASSPQHAPFDHRQGDGIRKRNGRIEIPQERSISTIDHMISSTTNEDLLKELKQQKRLLRNREAAQRKKRHTEDLELKEKSFAQQISHLENRVDTLTRENDHWQHERHAMTQRLDQYTRHIEAAEDEKREMIAKHNEETTSLRKKLRMLTDHLEAAAAPAMSAAPSSTGFTDFNAEMEALSMGTHEWDNFLFANELAHDPHDEFSFDPRPEAVKQSPEMESKVSTTAVAAGPAKADQPIASGLLFMLLLWGAYVASKPASTQPADMPKMPADVRAAAPTVLNNLLSEANGAVDPDRAQTASRLIREPAPSTLSYAVARPGRLDRLHRTITSPTPQQELDQAYSLTTAEYATLTNMDIPLHNPGPGASRGETLTRPRRNLAEALASVEQESTPATNKAEVYTRSLLWDQIPAHVVKQFKELVRDRDEMEARELQQRQQQQHHHSAPHDFGGFKIEP